MRFGWIRFNMPVELDYVTGTSTCLEERLSMVHTLLMRGHSVRLFTRCREFEDTRRMRNKIGRMRFFRERIDYDPDATGISECDILLVEFGTTNMNYMNPWKKEPWIRTALDTIAHYSGVVLYYQADVLLPFPFKQIGFTDYPWGHPKNGYCGGPRGKLWTVKSGWGTEEELSDGKLSYVVGNTRKYKLWQEFSNGTRFGYQDLKISRLAYVPVTLNWGLETHLKPVEEPKHGLVYCGSNRSRMKAFREFYNLPERVNVWGRWEPKVQAQFENIKFHGWLKYYWQVAHRMNQGLATVQIAPEKGRELGWTTPRPYEAARAYCLALIDARLAKNLKYNIDGLDSLVFPWATWWIKDKKGLMDVLSAYRSLSVDKRIEFLCGQYEQASEWNFDLKIACLERIAEKALRLYKKGKRGWTKGK